MCITIHLLCWGNTLSCMSQGVRASTSVASCVHLGDLIHCVGSWRICVDHLNLHLQMQTVRDFTGHMAAWPLLGDMETRTSAGNPQCFWLSHRVSYWGTELSWKTQSTALGIKSRPSTTCYDDSSWAVGSPWKPWSIFIKGHQNPLGMTGSAWQSVPRIAATSCKTSTSTSNYLSW